MLRSHHKEFYIAIDIHIDFSSLKLSVTHSNLYVKLSKVLTDYLQLYSVCINLTNWDARTI